MYDTPALCSSQEAFEFTPTGSKSVLWLGVGSFDGLQEMHGWAVDENSEKTRLPSGPLQEGCEPREITYKVVFLNMSLLLLLLWWNNSGAKKKKASEKLIPFRSIARVGCEILWFVLRPWRVFSFRIVDRKCAEYKCVCSFLFRSSFWRSVQIRKVSNLTASIGCSSITFGDI